MKHFFALLLVFFTAYRLSATELCETLYQAATSKDRQGTFVQTKYLSDVKLTLHASGAYLLRPQQQFILWQTLKPFEQTFLLRSNGIAVWKETAFETLTQSSDTATQCILQILSGNQARLQETFLITQVVEPSAATTAWSLTLVPREAVLKTWLKEIQLSGHANDLEQVILYYTQGDRVTQQFTPQAEIPPSLISPLATLQ